MDVAGGLSIFDKVIQGGKFLLGQYRKNPAHYLDGELTSGLEIAYRIIALFEAHDVKRTQIYRILGDKFPEVTPALDVEKLQSILNGELVTRISEIFGVRQAWIEGEAGHIYDPLCHYKNFPDLVDFARKLKDRNPESFCLLTALKPSGTSDDLYKGNTEVALFFSEPITELDRKTIYRYYPIYGSFPWNHTPARYHLCAFMNVVDRISLFPVKGCSVPKKAISKVSSGEAIPHYQMKTTGVWHPENYGYPLGHTIGKLNLEDWQGVLEYFGEAKELRNLNPNFTKKLSKLSLVVEK